MYRIVNDTAAAFGIREVQFSDGVSAREDDTLAAWLVQFTLSEKASNPEKVEQRRAANGVSSQSAPGQSVGGVAGGSGAGGKSADGQELSGFEKTLKKLDDYLAPQT